MKQSLIIQFLFFPISFLWGKFYLLRRFLYKVEILKSYEFQVPIISVGNLSFGGTGKTPMIVWLSRFINDRGLAPMILTRGYKSQLENHSGVLLSGQKFKLNPYDYGDEPLMISQQLSRGAVVVGKKRAQNLIRYFHELKPDIVLLDDGFQHLKIKRNLNIALFDALIPHSKYKTPPFGILREELFALNDADWVIFSRADMASREDLENLKSFLKTYLKHEPKWAEIKYASLGLFNAYEDKVMDLHELKAKKILAVSALANPTSFYQSLSDSGAIVVETKTYPDHHFFSLNEINEILALATMSGCTVVCSEKDMVKIKRVTQDSRIHYIKIKVEFISQEKEFVADLEKLLMIDRI
jgi:tetraacyldisaccharide 4'-kinase